MTPKGVDFSEAGGHHDTTAHTCILFWIQKVQHAMMCRVLLLQSILMHVSAALDGGYAYRAFSVKKTSRLAVHVIQTSMIILARLPTTLFLNSSLPSH